MPDRDGTIKSLELAIEREKEELGSMDENPDEEYDAETYRSFGFQEGIIRGMQDALWLVRRET